MSQLSRSALFGLMATAFTAATPLFPRQANGTNTTLPNSFKDIPVTEELVYTPCIGTDLSCANIQVPLDYDNPSAGTTNVAFLRWNTPNQPAKGDVLINPGGPGGSGVEYVASQVAFLRSLIGESYNFVGMDPRGVNNSGPNLDCFDGSPATRDYYDTLYYMEWDLSSPQNVAMSFQRAGAFGEWCGKTLNETAKYANTPAVAMDMLHYAELLAESKGEAKEEAKVDYYGVSYGSILGTTFATLFPDRIGHFVIDGVADGEDYYEGGWLENLLQADEAILEFFQHCFEAGSLCGFYSNDSSPDAIKQRFDAILKDLEENPIIVSEPSVSPLPTIITRKHIDSLVLLQVYNANAGYPVIAASFTALEQRNVSAILELYGDISPVPLAECDKASPDYSSVHPKLMIACNDQHGNYNISTPEELLQYNEDQKNVSSYLGDIWTPIITPSCRQHAFVPPESQLFAGFKEVKTNNPILFTANRIDPVTSSRVKMSKFFPGSQMLVQDAIGHGLQVASSKCIYSYTQKYFEDFSLPPADTECKTETGPFQPTTEEKRGVVPRSLKELPF